jgi:hypothetical protein
MSRLQVHEQRSFLLLCLLGSSLFISAPAIAQNMILNVNGKVSRYDPDARFTNPVTVTLAA